MVGAFSVILKLKKRRGSHDHAPMVASFVTEVQLVHRNVCYLNFTAMKTYYETSHQRLIYLPTKEHC